MKTIPSNEPTVEEKIADAVQGTDPPIEVAYPGAAPSLVLATYPVVLALTIIIALAIFAFYRWQSPASAPLDSPTPASQGTP